MDRPKDGGRGDGRTRQGGEGEKDAEEEGMDGKMGDALVSQPATKSDAWFNGSH